MLNKEKYFEPLCSGCDNAIIGDKGIPVGCKVFKPTTQRALIAIYNKDQAAEEAVDRVRYCGKRKEPETTQTGGKFTGYSHAGWGGFVGPAVTMTRLGRV